MSSKSKVSVSIYWDGKITHDGNTVYYNCPPKHNAKYSINVRYHKFLSSIYKRMGINSTDYNLIIVGKYPISFLSQGQVNFGEWIIYNDESLTDFLRVPNDYIDQIKLTILEIYVRKEPKTSQQRSPLSVDVHPRLENRNSVDGFPITQSTDFPNMTHYQNILTGRYDFDLNEIINESIIILIIYSYYFVYVFIFLKKVNEKN